MATRSRDMSLAFDPYSGSRSVLKQVWLVASLPESGPLRWITTLRDPRPPIGALQEFRFRVR